ncbi:MAG TPA: septum formation initiator family protein [Candidatus Gracilibacteria bacterium]|nr:septum formation initiator family protein [Candidatus Gracilibacteria bacterium]
MALRFAQTSHGAKLVIIGLLLLVSYLLFTLTSSVYRSHQLDVVIREFEVENSRIEEEIRNKSEELGYYNSEAYIEKIAKQNLGLVNYGEEVIIIPEEVLDSEVDENGQRIAELEDTRYESMSNVEKWGQFFFDR